jgi:hypothetical protein
MKRIDTSTKATDLFGAGKHGFRNSNLPLGVAATDFNADWPNNLQEEVARVVEAAGIALDGTVFTQLLQAIRSNAVLIGADAGVANASVLSFTMEIAALADGMVLWFKAAATNTGPTTLNVSGLGAKAVVGGGQVALQGGEIVANGRCMVIWSAPLNSFILVECTGAALQVAPGTKSGHAAQVAQVAGVVGSVRNFRAAQTVASASLVITADEVVVQSALGGSRLCIPGFNKTLNVGTVGAGGMDIGAAPVSGWVALYAIGNPATGANHVLGVNATAAVAPEVYGGASMPVGYTHSALIGVWPTTAAGLLAVARQTDREVYYYRSIYNGAGTSSVFTLLSIAGAVPKNAVRWKGNTAMAASGDGGISTAVCPTALGQGTPGYVAQQSYAAANTTVGGTYPDCLILTPQTTYFATSNNAGVGTFTINCYGFTF